MKPLTLLYPSRCMLCGKPVPEELHGLCMSCYGDAEEEMRQMICRPPEHADAMICAARYSGHMRRAVINLKFEQRRAYLKPLAELMALAWELHHMPVPDIITCVPISPARAHGRGFNQSAALAKVLAMQWDVPFKETLRRRVLSRRQSNLRAAERWTNARRAFVPRIHVDLDGKTVLLVDDIVTTGATVSTCAGLLRQMGARCVWVLAAARA